MNQILLAVILFGILISGCTAPKEDTKQEEIVSGTGTIKYLDLEGGFYGIITDDGKKYRPVNLPKEFAQDDLRVSFKAKKSKQQVSIQMWGTTVEVIEIQKIKKDEVIGSQEIDSFEECAKAGYPVMESYPRQCKTPDGRKFTEILEQRITCVKQGGNICSSSQTCSGEWLSTSDSNRCCDEECETSEVNVPYSFLYVHTECWEENGVCVTDPNKWGKASWQGPYDQVEWIELGKLVELADKYNVPLTLMFWPTAVDVILKNQSKIDTIKLWQANGHEIGIHVQYNGQGKFNPEKDMEKYHLLLDSKYQQVIKSGTTVDKDETTPTEMIYDVGGRAGPDDTHKDGRNSKAVMNIFNEHLTYRLNGRAEYLYPKFKITEYNSLNPNEIYGAGLHPVDIMSNRTIIEDWFKFLYEKDPEGKKRMTVSDLMETYIIPNDLIIHERCGNTVWDGDERKTGLCEIDHANCEKSNGDIRVCDNGFADQIYLMGKAN